jgi:hypothetical protein
LFFVAGAIPIKTTIAEEEPLQEKVAISEDKKEFQSNIHFGPGKKCKDSIINLIENASKSIEISIGCINDRDIYDAIINAMATGVNVTMFNSIENIKKAGCARWVSLDLMANGAVLFGLKEDGKAYKYNFAIVDDSIVFTGTYTWTYASVKQKNFCIILTEPLFVDIFNTQLDSLKRTASDNVITLDKIELNEENFFANFIKKFKKRS